MEPGFTRMFVTMNRDLLRRLDHLGKDNGYSSRSEGIREAIRDYVTYDDWMSNLEGNVTTIVQIIYDHDKHKDLDSLIDIYNLDRTVPIICLPYDKKNDLRVLALKDDSENLRNLALKIMASPGVKNVRLSRINFSES
jgi:CopG family transcriptional regulator, nickel-responsive regulator